MTDHIAGIDDPEAWRLNLLVKIGTAMHFIDINEGHNALTKLNEALALFPKTKEEK